MSDRIDIFTTPNSETLGTKYTNIDTNFSSIFSETPRFYEVQDDIKHTVTVNPDGSQDYTTITDAYDAILDSSFHNQYEIIVYPGVYASERQGLVPPPYSHTKALYKGSVTVVQSVIDGDGGTHISVFDPQPSCKLSGLHILSETADLYAMHGQPDVGTIIKVSHCVIQNTGGGAGRTMSGDAKGNTLIFESCKFLSNATGGSLWATRIHTVPTQGEDWNMRLEFHNCTISGGLGLNSYGGNGRSTCLLVNCEIPSVFFTHLDENDETDIVYYPANNNEWEVIGGGNNTTMILNSSSNGEALIFTTDNVDEQISVSGTAVDDLFGVYNTVVGDARIEGKIIGYGDVRDVQNVSLDVVQMWKRLGDCSVVNKDLTVTVDGSPETHTFTTNFETAETAEATIIAAVNASITAAVLSKYNRFDSYERIHLENKKLTYCAETGGILKGEIVYSPVNEGALSVQEALHFDVTGIALNDAAEGELLEIWTGSYFISGAADGEYGVGASNTLSISATNKIGYIREFIFYPYY